MPKLTDTQSMLLAHAAQHDDGSALPLPASLADTDRATKALAALAKRGFLGERETSTAVQVHRTDGDLRYGYYLTLAGYAAINIDPPAGEDETAPRPVLATPPSGSKAKTVLSLLSRAEGATLAELIEATGWLPHTTRAALTGLRKKGHAISRDKRDGVTCYRKVAA